MHLQEGVIFAFKESKITHILKHHNAKWVRVVCEKSLRELLASVSHESVGAEELEKFKRF